MDKTELGELGNKVKYDNQIKIALIFELWINGFPNSCWANPQTFNNLDSCRYSEVGSIYRAWSSLLEVRYLALYIESLGIDGSCLHSLTEDDFRVELGVSSKIMLRKIMTCTGVVM